MIVDSFRRLPVLWQLSGPTRSLWVLLELPFPRADCSGHMWAVLSVGNEVSASLPALGWCLSCPPRAGLCSQVESLVVAGELLMPWAGSRTLGCIPSSGIALCSPWNPFCNHWYKKQGWKERFPCWHPSASAHISYFYELPLLLLASSEIQNPCCPCKP